MEETLSSLLGQLRSALSQVRLTLPLPGSAQAKTWATAAVSQLDDYVIPRLQAIEAPLLTVVGGSTGAGKSTLVNSLLRQVVTTTGVIRPTTKAPVLIHHPDDAHWFNSDRVFPELARCAGATDNPRSLQILACEAVPAGLAILDAPDIDSVDVENRTLAAQLLAAADLWLFITSAARYADAVPWEYLSQAAQRSAGVAVVVDRVPPAAMRAVPEHLAQMMTQRGLGDSTLFAVPETVTDDDGLLPVAAVEPIRAWLHYLADDQMARVKVVMGTLDGAIAALENGVQAISDQVSAQNRCLTQLKADAAAIFKETKRSVRAASSDGTLLRGEVMARWQDFVGTGDFMRSIESTIGRARDRIGRFFTGRADKAFDVQVAVKSGLETLIIEAGESAVERVEASWLADPAGRYLMQWCGADIGTIAPDFPAQVEDAIRRWQEDVMGIVSKEGAGRRTKARLAALGVNAAGVSLMLVAFSHTAGMTGAEIGIAGGTAIVAQKVLELIFGDEVIRRLAAMAEEQLSTRMDGVLQSQLDRLLSLSVDRFPAETLDSQALVRLGAKVGAARLVETKRLAAGAHQKGEVGDDGSV
ncbi:MAG: GTPase domain-containing protein [Propionibacteriaceae bacterium]|nr:GTPase domain-containing protein [Propionibacteriaceae bacterium]